MDSVRFDDHAQSAHLKLSPPAAAAADRAWASLCCGCVCTQAIYNEEVKRKNPHLRSPTETRNGLMLCEHCDDPFERHFIDIEADGTIAVDRDSEWYKELGGAQLKKYKVGPSKYSSNINAHGFRSFGACPAPLCCDQALNGKLVPWADSIGTAAYPTKGILQWRKTLPYVKSAEGRALIKRFHDQALKLKRKAPIPVKVILDELDSPAANSKPSSKKRPRGVAKQLTMDEEEEEDEEQPAKAKRKIAGNKTQSSKK